MSGASPRQQTALPVLPWGMAVALVAALLAAVFALSMSPTTLWRRALQDAGHGPVFAGIAIALLLSRAPPAGAVVRSWPQYRAAFLLALALGVVTELVQHWLPERGASLQDVLHDAAGATLGLSVSWWWERRHVARTQAAGGRDPLAPWVGLAGLAALTLLAWQPLQTARAYALRHSALPTLLPLGGIADASFAAAHQAEFVRAPLPERFRRAGDAESIRLRFAAGARPGLQLFEPVPDWRAHEVLAMDLTNPAAEPVRISVRVLDAAHNWKYEDRFNQTVDIPAATRVTLRFSLSAIAAAPSGRDMDLAAIADVMLFARRPLGDGDFYVTRIWLE